MDALFSKGQLKNVLRGRVALLSGLFVCLSFFSPSAQETTPPPPDAPLWSERVVDDALRIALPSSWKVMALDPKVVATTMTTEATGLSETVLESAKKSMAAGCKLFAFDPTTSKADLGQYTTLTIFRMATPPGISPEDFLRMVGIGLKQQMPNMQGEIQLGQGKTSDGTASLLSFKMKLPLNREGVQCTEQAYLFKKGEAFIITLSFGDKATAPLEGFLKQVLSKTAFTAPPAASAPIDAVAVQPATVPEGRPSQRLKDDSIILPTGFAPDDPAEVVKAIGSTKKDEFETTQQYVQRLKTKAPSGQYVFEYSGYKKYDADRQQWVIKLEVEVPQPDPMRVPTPEVEKALRQLRAISLSERLVSESEYVGTNAFGVEATITRQSYEIFAVAWPEKALPIRRQDITLAMPAELAKAAKENLQFLIQCMAEPSGTEGPTFQGFDYHKPTLDSPYEWNKNYVYLRMRPVALWIVDRVTGQIHGRAVLKP